MLFSVLLIAPVLWFTGTTYATYFEGAQFIHFLLGPATVALALPLWDNRDTIAKSVAPILLVVGLVYLEVFMPLQAAAPASGEEVEGSPA